MPIPTGFAPLQLCMMRVSTLTAAGKPVPGAFGFITDAINTAKIGLEIEAGEEFTVKNGCGAIAQYTKQGDHVKGSNITMELPNFDVALLSILIGNSTLMRDVAGSGAAEPMGWRAPTVASAAGNGVCLELWSKAWDSTSQAAPLTANATAANFHWVFPRVVFRLADIPLGNEFTTTTVEGVGSENAGITVDGPYNDWPADVKFGASGPSTVFSVWLEASTAMPASDPLIKTIPATS